MDFSFLSLALVYLYLWALIPHRSLADIDPIVAKGSHFFYKTNGSEFFIRGVAYSIDFGAGGTLISGPSWIDGLAQTTACARDIPYLQKLNTNVVHVYASDATSDHSGCMKLLQDAGIYLLLDLPTPATAISRDTPAWNADLLKGYTAIVDAFAQYPNVLGFVAGNELASNETNTRVTAYVKAAIRDTKAYIRQKNYRAIPVGYATNDDAVIRVEIGDYFNCGDTAEQADFLGYNIYSWCGDSSFTESGYDARTKEFSTYSVPVFFAEYGCKFGPTRQFTEVQAIYGDQMTPVWSGGIVYNYFQQSNNYGLVSVSGASVSLLPDFASLSSQIAKISPSSTAMSDYTPTNTAAACPQTATSWLASPTLPPTPSEFLCDCMVDSTTCAASGAILDQSLFEQLVNEICGTPTCAGILANATTGEYGAFSMCNITQQLSFAFNHRSTFQDGGSCDYNGYSAAKNRTSGPSACRPVLAEANVNGTGTVTSLPVGTATLAGTGTAASSSSSSSGSPGSGSGGSGSGSSSGSGAAASSGGGLSTGAKIGIGVGIGLGVVVLLIFAYVFWRRRKRQQRATKNGDWNKPELPSNEVRMGESETGAVEPKPFTDARAELGGDDQHPTLRYEMDSEAPQVHEIHTEDPAMEMSGLRSPTTGQIARKPVP